MTVKLTARALGVILGTVFLDAVGFGIVMPVTPKLVSELAGVGLSDAAGYFGALLVTYSLLQFACAPLMGGLSDALGRRPVLLACLAAFGLDYVFMALAPTLGWLFVGRAIAGVAGASHAPAAAWMADMTPPEERARRFGQLSAMWGVGFIVGPVIGGLLGGFGPRVPFLAAAVLAFANCAAAVALVPETLPPERRRPLDLRRANALGALLGLRARPFLAGLMAVIVCNQIAHDANPSAWTLYTMLKFGWSETQVGLSLAAIGFSIAVVMSSLTGALVPRIGRNRTIVIGYAGAIVGFAGFALATEGWMMYPLIVIWSLLGLVGPSLRGMMSAHVPPDAQGELQGAIQSVGSLTAIFSPLLMTQVFHYFTHAGAVTYLPGAPFLLAAVFMAAGGVACLAVFRRWDAA